MQRASSTCISSQEITSGRVGWEESPMERIVRKSRLEASFCGPGELLSFLTSTQADKSATVLQLASKIPNSAYIRRLSSLPFVRTSCLSRTAICTLSVCQYSPLSVLFETGIVHREKRKSDSAFMSRRLCSLLWAHRFNRSSAER